MQKSYKDIATKNQNVAGATPKLLAKTRRLRVICTLVNEKKKYINKHSCHVTQFAISNVFSICDDIWIEIIYFLFAKDAINIKMTCQHFGQLFSMNENNLRLYKMNRFWKRECHRICTIVVPCFTTDDWYKLFIDIVKTLHDYHIQDYDSCCLAQEYCHYDYVSFTSTRVNIRATLEDGDGLGDHGSLGDINTWFGDDCAYTVKSRHTDLIFSVYYGFENIQLCQL